ncbi:MAG: hypothetical protein R2939_04810 [Kofleriaceae bacterium]
MRGVKAIGVVALIASVLGGPRTARADDEDGDWYGWQLMITDIGAITVAAAGASTNKNPGAVVGGAAAYVLSGPLIHLAHGEGRDALTSLLLRTVPAGVGLMFNAAGSKRGATAILVFAGAFCTVVDWLGNSNEPAPGQARIAPPVLAFTF